nr:hypothetical protein [Tanacetum cinerariifolium]
MRQGVSLLMVVLVFGDYFDVSKEGCWIAMGNVDPYLGGEAHRRAWSHGGSHTLLSRPAISNLCPTFSLRYANKQSSSSNVSCS